MKEQVSRVPKPPKEGYTIIPSMSSLAMMSADQLKRVRNLKIENQFGSIEFEGETDVTDIDFADLVTISKQNAEVYDDQRHQKPPIG